MTPDPGGEPAVTEDVVPDDEHPVLVRLRMEGSLGSRVAQAIAWAGSTRLLMQVLTLGSQVVLARLLMPSDYGLVAIALVLNGLAGLLTELGLSAAVVQARQLTDRLLTTAFWLNALSGVVITAILFALAPVVAWFYDESRVTQLVQVSSLAFALNVASVPSALLQRALRFKTIGTWEVASTVLGLVVTVVMAFTGGGALSLVVGPLAKTVCMNSLLWSSVRWLPRGFMHRRELRQLWRFGGGLTGSNVLYFISRNADTVLLGKVVSVAQLGLYSRSYNLMMLPLTQVSGVLTKVLLPAYAEMQDDLPRLRRAWSRTLRLSLLVGLPSGLGVAVSAPALVETLYGTRWLDMVPTLTLLAASVPPQLVGRNLGPLYQALGKTGLQFNLAIVSTVVTVAAIVAGLPWGIEGVALALLIKCWTEIFLPLLPALRLIEMPLRDLVAVGRASALAALVMCLSALGVGQLADSWAAPLELSAQVIVGGAAYLLVLWFVERDLLVSLLTKVRRRRSS